MASVYYVDVAIPSDKKKGRGRRLTWSLMGARYSKWEG